MLDSCDYAQFRRSRERRHPPLAPRLFRQYLLSRRQDRRTDRHADAVHGRLDNTIILFCSDHGDMLGERGLWFKMNFFEGSARVPLMIAGARHLPPGLRGRRSRNLDVLPTLADLAGIRSGRDHALDRRREPDGPCIDGEPHRAGADGICRRRLLRAAGRAPRRASGNIPLRYSIPPSCSISKPIRRS